MNIIATSCLKTVSKKDKSVNNFFIYFFDKKLGRKSPNIWGRKLDIKNKILRAKFAYYP